METLHTVLKHGAMYSDWEAFPPSVFAERVERTKRAIGEAGDDAWIIYGDAQHYGELAYLTHFLPRLRSSLVLIAQDREPVVLTCVGSRDIPAMQVLTPVRDIRPYWRLPEAMPKFIAEEGLAAGRIGLVGIRESMPIGEWNAIRSALPTVKWTFRDPEFAKVRRPDDVTAKGIAVAKSVVDEGLRAAQQYFHEGMTLRTASAEVERVVRKLAAEDVRILVGSQSGAQGHLRPPDDAPVVEGYPVSLFLACEVQRCWAEAAVTIAPGSGSSKDRILSETAERALAAMIGVVTPEAKAEAVWNAAMQTIDEPELRSCAGEYGLGHGIGLDEYEKPEIAKNVTDDFTSCAGVALHVVLKSGGALGAAGKTLIRTDGKFAE